MQQRLTFKPNSKGENSAPVVFQYDPNGDLLDLVLELRSALPAQAPEIVQPPKDNSLVTDDKFDEAEITKTFFIELKAERILRQQREMIEEWITGLGSPDDDDHQLPGPLKRIGTRLSYTASSPTTNFCTCRNFSACMTNLVFSSCSG